MRAKRAVIGVAAVLGGLLIGGVSAFGAGASSTPTGGTVHVILQPSGKGTGKILITGAIGDYGTSLDIDKDGKPDPNSGNYGKITLSKGTFEINRTTLDADANKVSPPVDQATCSAELSVTGPVTTFDGTGLYKGISGTVNVTESYGFIGSFYTSGKKKGQCNESNNAPTVAQLGTVVGTGTVKFT